MPMEEFAPIEWYTQYLISESGRIWSEEHYDCIGKLIKGRMRAPNWRGGYMGMWMLCDDGEWYYNSIHHLVAEVYIGPRPEGLNVLHKDDNRYNNHWSNLEYGTQSQNLKQAYDRGRKFFAGNQWTKS